MTEPAALTAAIDAQQTVRLVRETFDIKANAILGLKNRIGPSFVQAMQAMLVIRGRVVVMGMGKSGHIRRKMAATLARHADMVLDCGVEKEACPLNLAPTASSVAQMAMGGALAVGRRSSTHVRDVMRTGDAVPRVASQAGLTEVMREMSRKGLGAVTIVDDPRQPLLGIFTDGDLRRLVENGADLRVATAHQVMRASPKTILPSALAVDAAQLMERHRITSVLVVDETGALCGALNSNDLMRAKVI